MVVVITVIVLVLALAVPGLTAMNAQARMSSAVQTINGVLTRACFLSTATQSMTAVRFVPGAWDAAEESDGRPTGRQHLAIYSYVGTSSADVTKMEYVEFGEHFRRAEDVASARLPEEVWAAPLEALSEDRTALGSTLYTSFGRDFVLKGTIGDFAFDAAQPSTLLNADDFLIVFDPQAGMRTGVPVPFRLWAYAPPPTGYETDRDPNAYPPIYYQRYNFSGVVVYRREQFALLGKDASGAERQDWLRDNGQTYMTHRFSGGLLSGTQRR